MERLHNGITLPAQWPPNNLDMAALSTLPVPYLERKPDVIGIDVGRQLFVDNFLIAETTLEKHFHQAEYHPASPILKPETPLEMFHGLAPMATPFTDGCWYDPSDNLFKLYYHAGWMAGTALAVSKDGLEWTRRMLDHVPGTNRILNPPAGWRRDGSTIWLDQDADNPHQRYKMFQFYRTPDAQLAHVHTSRDGMHWSAPTKTGKCGDNSSFFYDPFRKKWVFSIRVIKKLENGLKRRLRYYYPCDDFIAGANWVESERVPWLRCDEGDCTNSTPGVQFSQSLPPQMYHVNAVGYESLMLGLFGILKGFDEKDNKIYEETGQPKYLDLHVAFSRDGFHFSRDHRAPFIPCSNQPGTWNRGYLHACGGLCLVMGDELWFPVGGFSGASPVNGGHLYGGASTGIATLRRDGFVSMAARYTRQTLLTEPIMFQEGTHLFVNAKASEGYVACEITDKEGNTLTGFGFDDCIPAQGDGTCQMIRFTGSDLSKLRGKPVRLRFHVLKSALFAFWISPDEAGKSGGYLAAGGPGYKGNRDS